MNGEKWRAFDVVVPNTHRITSVSGCIQIESVAEASLHWVNVHFLIDYFLFTRWNDVVADETSLVSRLMMQCIFQLTHRFEMKTGRISFTSKFFNLDFPRVKFAAAAYNFVCELAGWCWQNKLEKTELEIEWKFSYSSLNISIWKDFFFMKNMSFDSTLNGDAVMFGKVIENGQREFSHRLEPWDTANQSNPIRKAQSHVKAASKHPLKPQVGTCIFSVLENISIPT